MVGRIAGATAEARLLRELEASSLEPPREPDERGTPGRPSSLPRRVVERIRLEYARGRGLAEIARALNDDGIPTAHGGRQWWPSTVRAILVRSCQAASKSAPRPTKQTRALAAASRPPNHYAWPKGACVNR